MSMREHNLSELKSAIASKMGHSHVEAIVNVSDMTTAVLVEAMFFALGSIHRVHVVITDGLICTEVSWANCYEPKQCFGYAEAGHEVADHIIHMAELATLPF